MERVLRPKAPLHRQVLPLEIVEFALSSYFCAAQLTYAKLASTADMNQDETIPPPRAPLHPACAYEAGTICAH
jgi:hypothetical protein